MITYISIKNYKGLKNLNLECSNLNLLTGLNGMGKSSILQTLLLLRQSNIKGSLNEKGLDLKGELIDIGNGKDVLCQSASNEEITFGIAYAENETPTINYEWIFSYDKDYNSDFLAFAKETIIPTDINKLPLFNSSFKYLNTERLVKDQYGLSESQVVKNRNLGVHGEFTAHFLEYYGTKKGEEVNSLLLYPGTSTTSLSYQVSAWMNEISPGTIVNTEKLKGLDSIKLSYKFESITGPTDEVSPTNAGFGITYVLPIIVALLSAKPNDILLIENPESHIHPQGQAAVAKLIALTAQQGVQIFVETHSDHIINGVLVSINQDYKKITLGIKSKNVKIYFIDRDLQEHISNAHSINILEDGKIKNAPAGFFDQFAKDLKTIIGF